MHEFVSYAPPRVHFYVLVLVGDFDGRGAIFVWLAADVITIADVAGGAASQQEKCQQRRY